MNHTINAYHATKTIEHGNYDSPVAQFIGLISIGVLVGLLLDMWIDSSKDNRTKK
jgi:hypothetical protein